MADKRRISLRFNLPYGLENKVIYVSFSPADMGVRASAVSDTTFIYSQRLMSGQKSTKEGLTANTAFITNDSKSWERPYREFLQELADLNNGEIDYSGLIEDGVSTSRLIMMITNAIKNAGGDLKSK